MAAAAAVCPLEELLGTVASPSRRGRGTMSVRAATSDFGFSPPQRGSSPPAKASSTACSLREKVAHEEEPISSLASPSEDNSETTSPAGETCREALQRLAALEEEVEELRWACHESGDAINSLMVDDSEASKTNADEAEGEAVEIGKFDATAPAALLERLDGCSEADLFLWAQERLESLELERARLLARVEAATDAIARVAELCRDLNEHLISTASLAD